MRRMFSMLGARVAVALALVLVVSGVVAVAKLANHGRVTGARPVDGRTVLPTVNVTAGDDGDVSPTPSAYPDNPAVIAAASAFIKQWLRSDRSMAAWHDAVSRYATTALSAKLDGVDPAGVPAKRTTGPITLLLRSGGYAEVAVPVETGTVRLSLLLSSQHWLVDGVDWSRAA